MASRRRLRCHHRRRPLDRDRVDACKDVRVQARKDQTLGERTQVAPMGLKANAVEWRDGAWVGAADPRSEGVSMGLDGKPIKPVTATFQKDRPSE